MGQNNSGPSRDQVTIKKRRPQRSTKLSNKPPQVFPASKCKLRMLKLQRLNEFLLIEDTLLLPYESSQQKSQIDQIRGVPLDIGTLEEIIDESHAIVSSGLGPEYFVFIHSFVDKDALEPGCTVLLNHRDHSVVGILQGETDPMVSSMKLEKAPTESYADIGGLEQQIREIKESVELPLTNPELYSDMGIRPPRGVILYGLPGTGKTLLAKAVANQTNATFLRIVGSELIQKYLGDGPKLVRELFKVAEQNAPSIIFIDEIDAIGAKRYETSSEGTREIQRTMLELLNQLDGFKEMHNVKVIMATNKIEVLDPALIRPGRIDRKIEFGIPDLKTKKSIFMIHSSRMSLDVTVDIDKILAGKEDLTGADIKSICTEAGMLALRERRRDVGMTDFVKAKEKIISVKSGKVPIGMYA